MNSRNAQLSKIKATNALAGITQYAYDGPRPVASLPGSPRLATGLGPGLPRADSNRSSHTVHTSGALITEAIYLNDTTIAAIKAAGAYLIQADHWNTPRAILGVSNGASPRIQAARGMRGFQKTNHRRYCDSLSYHHAHKLN